jgi:hypothetical protein
VADVRRNSSLATGMCKRFVAPLTALLMCLTLGSCAQFAATVSDHWPTWLGGMPNDVPPRPGAPGYDEFLAHQRGKDAASPPTPANKAEASAPSANQPAANSSAVQGGLY